MTLTPRESFELAGFHVSDLTDEQLDHAAIVLVAAAGDELPTLQDIAIQLDEVRFRAKLTIVDEAKSPLGKSVPEDPFPSVGAASSAFVRSNEFMPAHPARGRRRPLRLAARPHGACAVAHADNRDTCSRCAPLLHASDCGCYWCGYFNEHADDEAMS